MKLFDATIFHSAHWGNVPQRVGSCADTPLPDEFDFNNPEECARKVCAIMINVAGTIIGWNCRVRFNEVLGTACITDDMSFSVLYLPRERVDATHPHPATIDMYLGAVQVGPEVPGWEKAVWKAPR